jgi:cobalt/nickel transport system permease protein
MHIPDGFIDPATSLAAGALAVAGLGVAVKKSGDVLEDREVPLAGLVAAFVFAAQMLNFPVAAGTSGHLIGATLTAVLVGPWVGALCIAVVLMVQALFADGGITALGLNVLNMAMVGGWLGYALFAGLRSLGPGDPKPRGWNAASAGVAAGASVVLAALAFTAEYAVGGSGVVSLGALTAAMAGVHVLIGAGEGVITGAAVAMVLAVRPDLVYALRATGARPAASPRPEHTAV